MKYLFKSVIANVDKTEKVGITWKSLDHFSNGRGTHFGRKDKKTKKEWKMSCCYVGEFVNERLFYNILVYSWKYINQRISNI